MRLDVNRRSVRPRAQTTHAGTERVRGDAVLNL